MRGPSAIDEFLPPDSTLAGARIWLPRCMTCLDVVLPDLGPVAVWFDVTLPYPDHILDAAAWQFDHQGLPVTLAFRANALEFRAERAAVTLPYTAVFDALSNAPRRSLDGKIVRAVD